MDVDMTNFLYYDEAYKHTLVANKDGWLYTFIVSF